MVKVAIVATMPQVGFSGGRYYALILAKALSVAGCNVTIITNNTPQMWQELEHIQEPIPVQIRTDLDTLMEGKDSEELQFDLVVAVPDGSFSLAHSVSLRIAIRSDSKLAMINFETPNWMNHLASTKKSPVQWWPWFWLGLGCDYIISNAFEGDKYARRYYFASKSSVFRVALPAINSGTAKLTERRPKQRTIFVPTRIRGGDHKGLKSLSEILKHVERPFSLILLVDDPHDVHLDSFIASSAGKISLRLHSNVSERKKFQLFAQSSVTLFPSTFEGFGYPPIESISVGTPCVSFDLPVFRETLGGALIRVKTGDLLAMAQKLNQVLSGREPHSAVPSAIQQEMIDKYSIAAFAQRLEDSVLSELNSRPTFQHRKRLGEFVLRIITQPALRLTLRRIARIIRG